MKFSLSLTHKQLSAFISNAAYGISRWGGVMSCSGDDLPKVEEEEIDGEKPSFDDLVAIALDENPQFFIHVFDQDNRKVLGSFNSKKLSRGFVKTFEMDPELVCRILSDNYSVRDVDTVVQVTLFGDIKFDN
jgi:hypothetical protein